MRFALALVLTLMGVSTALAGDWNRYENARFGFGIDVPPELHALPATTNTGDQIFTSIDGTEVLTVKGGTVLPGSFNSTWERTQAGYESEGWTLTYEPVAPEWTSFTGTRDGRALFVKMLPLCGGTKQYAMIAFEYPKAEMEELAPVAQRLAVSMTRLGTGFGC